jgi:hypothetical protein
MTKEERMAYTEKVNQEIAELRDKLAADHPWLNMVQASRVWDYAWQQGHASGLYEVEIVYKDVARLFQ